MSNREFTPNIRDFYAAFDSGSVYIAGEAYPVGSFAVDAMNIGWDLISDLYAESKPVEKVCEQMHNGIYDPDMLFAAAPHILKIIEMMTRIRPFPLFDNSRLLKQAGAYLYKYYTNIKSMGTETHRILAIQNERIVKRTIPKELGYYAYFADAFCSYRNILTRFCDLALPALDKCDKQSLAKAWCEYYRYNNIRTQTIYSPFDDRSDLSVDYGFSSLIHSDVIYDAKEHADDIYGFVRSYHFDSLITFLTMDFFEGLMAGHYPRRCAMCERYFLMENARGQKYCNGYLPGNDNKRTCRAAAAKKKERELAVNHPAKALYKTRCNTTDHHRRSGVISEEKASIVKELARSKMYHALDDNQYFLCEYAKEMAMDAIYAEADAIIAEG